MDVYCAACHEFWKVHHMGNELLVIGQAVRPLIECCGSFIFWGKASLVGACSAVENR